MTIREEITALLEKAKADIQAQMAAKRINASGRTSASLHVEDYGQGIRLLGGGQGAAPVPTLEVGREGGRVPRGFYYIIKQWTIDKGISFSRESERQTFAYFLARRIAREGTRRFKQHEDVYSTVVTKAVGDINEVLKRYIFKDLREAWKARDTVSAIKTNF